MNIIGIVFPRKKLSRNNTKKMNENQPQLQQKEQVLMVEESILLIGNSAASLEDVKASQSKLHALGKKVAFEQLDRLASIQLKTMQYSLVLTGHLSPPAFPHSLEAIPQFAKTLKTGGRLEITEPCLIDTGALLKLQEALSSSNGGGNDKKPSSSNLLPFRTERSLNSELVMNGFVNIQVTQRKSLDKETIHEWLVRRNLWGLIQGENAEDVETAETVEKILEDGNLVLVSITCSRPAYAMGAGVKLSFGGRKKVAAVTDSLAVTSVTANAAEFSATTKKVSSVWKVSALDDDDLNQDGEEVELENEDDLLDESDLIIPATAPAGDCSTKKKACKDCSCGRAEEEERELFASITVVVPKKTVVSSCGSCYLGDAFRCSSCPYLGMPSFKPGEKVSLAGNLLTDDL